MITCRLKGGLGNLLFQIAAIEAMSIDSGIPSTYYNVNSQIKLINDDLDHNPTLKHANEYIHIFKNFDWNKNSVNNISFNSIKVPFHYVKIQPKPNTCYDGFFQSEKFFKHREKEIRNLFEPSTEIAEYIKSKYSFLFNTDVTSIHVRRGDYLKISHIHPLHNMDYFNAGINLIGNESTFLIFSDDIEWCKENFKGDNFIFFNEKDYIELFMMSYCKNNIMSNSSFSWWGSWLNKNPDKKVIAPMLWFSQEAVQRKGINPIDIIPQTFIKI
jgi:hypothetical protein